LESNGRLPVRIPRLLISVAVALLGSTLPTRTFAASVTFRVADVNAQAGSTIDVPITAVAAPGLSAVHLELTYDPKILALDAVSRGPVAGTNALVDYNGADPGRVRIGVATLDAIQGDGPLVIARFKVVGQAGPPSALTLDHSRAWESGAHAEVLVKTEGGKVTIAGGFPFLILGIVALCLVLFVIFIVAAIFVWRRLAASPSPSAGRRGPPPPPGDAAAAFRKAEDDYFRLKGRQSEGRMTQEQFETAMKDVMVEDAQGRYWTIDRQTGKWLVHTGQAWVEAQPY
jgi:hypothetical protein